MRLKVRTTLSLIIAIVISNGMLHAQEANKVSGSFPLDYMITLPTPTFEQWDKDYNSFNKYLTARIMKTQMGLASAQDSVQTWWCFPSAKTHAQLDTTTMIRDQRSIIGDWDLVTHRSVVFEDSAVYAQKKIYRNVRLGQEEQPTAYLSLSDKKYTVYEKSGSSYKRAGSSKYAIESGRYLMLYKLFKATAGISQIGLTKDGYLIVNGHFVEERKVKGKYIVYHATMNQMIFKRRS